MHSTVRINTVLIVLIAFSAWTHYEEGGSVFGDGAGFGLRLHTNEKKGENAALLIQVCVLHSRLALVGGITNGMYARPKLKILSSQ